MNPRRICMCCGEPMREEDSAHSRNPNMCASCSSMADGIDKVSLPALKASQPTPEPHPGPDVRSTTEPVVPARG
jgi:hypothetical protein